MRSVVAFLALLSLGACGQAGDTLPSAKESAVKLVEANAVLRLDDDFMTQVAKVETIRIRRADPTIDAVRGAALEQEIRDRLKANMPALKEKMAEHLVAAFNQGDLAKMAAFYDTEFTARLNAGMPGVAAASVKSASEIALDGIASNPAAAPAPATAPSTN